MAQERYLRAHALNHVPIIWPALFYDDSNGTYDWHNVGDGADFVGDYSNTFAFVGTNVIRLRTRATAPAIGDQISAIKYLFLPPTELGRLQVALRLDTNTILNRTTLAMLWYDGTLLHSAQIRFDGTNEEIQYRDHLGAWVPIPGLTFHASARRWHHLDFYANFQLNQYRYVTVNNNVVDLSGTPVLSAAGPTTPHLQLVLIVETRAAAIAGTLFDQILLTSETPD